MAKRADRKVRAWYIYHRGERNKVLTYCCPEGAKRTMNTKKYVVAGMLLRYTVTEDLIDQSESRFRFKFKICNVL